MPNEKLEKLKRDQYVAERKLTAAKHKEKDWKADSSGSPGASAPTAFALVPGCWKPF